MRRVAVTGMGIVSSIGNNCQEVLASLREAKSGIVRAEKYAELGFRCQVHGEPHLDWETQVPRKARRFMSDGIGWNYVAMEQAIRDAGRSLPRSLVQLEACIQTNRNRRQPSSDGSRSTREHPTVSHLLQITTNPIEGNTDVTTCILSPMDLCSAL